MNKENYFGMYIGQRVQYKFNGKIQDRELTPYFLMELSNCNEFSDVKLILRPISAMTEEENDRLAKILFAEDYKEGLKEIQINTVKAYLDNEIYPNNGLKKETEIISYLISIGIDVWDLHSTKIAIYE